MRLRLTVRRHAVPEAKILWSISCDADTTIAKLLQQVNEVLPLEAGEWGLEDYAVELRDWDGNAFECLHFQLVLKVLKEDDQILYVPHAIFHASSLLFRPD